MRAALYYGKNKVHPENTVEPIISSKDCLVEVEWCGLCGSDLHLYQLGAQASQRKKEHCN